MTPNVNPTLLMKAAEQAKAGVMTGSRVLTCCAYAIGIDNQEALRELLPLVDHVDVPMKGESLLSMAARVGSLESVRILVEEFNADANYADLGGRLPLDVAHEYGNEDVFVYLSGVSQPRMKDNYHNPVSPRMKL